MKLSAPRSAAPRPLAPAVVVAALSVLVGGLLPQQPVPTTAAPASEAGDAAALRTLAPAGSGQAPAAASDRKSTRLNSSHSGESRMPSSA